jgi:hypothetical protein
LESHYKLLEQRGKEHRIGFSGALRRIIDFALDHDPSLGLPFYEDREKSLQAELLAVQEARKKLEEEQKAKITDAPKKVFEEVTNPVTSESGRATPKALFIDKRGTEEEHWRKKVGYVLNPPPNLSKEEMEKVERNVFADAERHLDWLDELSEEQRAAFREKVALWKGRK